LRSKYPDCVFISALNGDGIKELCSHLSFFIDERHGVRQLVIPEKLTDLLTFIRNSGTIFIEEYDAKNKQHKLDVKMSDSIYKNVISQVEKYHLLNYINS